MGAPRSSASLRRALDRHHLDAKLSAARSAPHIAAVRRNQGARRGTCRRADVAFFGREQMSEPNDPDREPVRLSRRGAVAVLTIDREARRNALSRKTLFELGRFGRELVKDP